MGTLQMFGAGFLLWIICYLIYWLGYTKAKKDTKDKIFQALGVPDDCEIVSVNFRKKAPHCTCKTGTGGHASWCELNERDE